MLKLTLAEAVEASGGKYIGSEENLQKEIASVTTDSREAAEGSLFVAIKGERVDGHDFAVKAFGQGALCCLIERKIDADGPCILVKNSVEALQKIAAYYRESLGVKVVGITGSVGKTTCKELVAAVLAQKYNVLKTLGNYNNEIGLPLTLLRMTAETEAAVIEMGMSDFGEMRLLSSIAKPDMCVITNIGFSHMEILGSQQGILQAKSEIFEYMDSSAPAFLCGDDKLLRTVKRDNCRWFGFETENDIYVEDMCDKGLMGIEGVINAYRDKRLQFLLGIPGRHVLYSVMAAVGVGLELGLTDDEICAGIEAAATIGGRVNVINKDNMTVIDDCYNAAPASMKAGIDLLIKAGGETVAILGDMGELGNGAPKLHGEVGRYAAEMGVGLVFAVGELSKELFDACAAAGGRALYFPTKADLLCELPGLIPDKATVLVKASHFMGFDEIVKLLCA
ncbi:MAG: UDP-N-acetylmuramoyl-tripeptide--D-alanyl-D-alanine ligase [Oscillospiraceae bacterium]|nr:UDP-N-acetylmuramoyl-tripeptide--D-alanyl-D-alanine ligase [Oscillospiraceae bacterium]